MPAAPENSDDAFNVSIFTDMVLMEKARKKNPAIPYATRVANRTPEGELRRGTTTYRTPDARTKVLRLFNSIDIAELGDDLVMATLKYRGSRARRLKLAPNDETTNAHIEYFDDMLSEEIGEPVKFLWFKDMNEIGGGLHFHVLISRPKHLSAEEFDVMVRACWAITTGQPVEQATIGAAWTPKVSEVWYGKDAAQTFKNFIRYEAYKFNTETSKFELKVAQKRVDQAWLDTGNYRVEWAGISTSLLPTTPLELTITCACGNADLRSVMQEHSPAARNIVTFDCRENVGEKVDIDLGRWSFDLMGKGCTEFIRVTPELIEAIQSIEEAHADCTATAPVAAEEVSPVPATTPDVSTPAESTAAVPEALTKESTMEEINGASPESPVLPEPKVIRDYSRRAFASGTFYARLAEKDVLTDADKSYMVLIEEREEAKALHTAGAITFDEWTKTWERIHELTAPMARQMQEDSRAARAAEAL